MQFPSLGERKCPARSQYMQDIFLEELTFSRIHVGLVYLKHVFAPSPLMPIYKTFAAHIFTPGRIQVKYSCRIVYVLFRAMGYMSFSFEEVSVVEVLACDSTVMTRSRNLKELLKED